MKNIYLKIRELEEEHERVVLATVIETRGSTPQKAGSSALFSRNGLVCGTIGGGILEGKVQEISMKAALTGHTVIFHFELDKDIFHKDDAICGGQASVLIDANVKKHNYVFDEAAGLLGTGRPCIMLTEFTANDDGKNEVSRSILSDEKNSGIPENLRKEISSEAEKIMSPYAGRGGFAKIDFGKPGEKGGGFFLLEPLFPPLHLIIAGAGHIGRSLSHIGKLLDFEVTVIDDRSEFANASNLPDADHIITDNIERAVSNVAKNPDTYIVIVTRGHNDDANALKPCIGSKAAYIGMIGSKTKIGKMHRNFLENGWATEEQWSEIHAPIGLDINSKTVEEIAVSIAAELVQVRNREK